MATQTLWRALRLFLLLALAGPPAGRADSAQWRQISPLTFVVTSAIDALDSTPGDGICQAALANGVCTLRAAIMEANTHPGPDAIVFSINDTFSLSIAGANEDFAQAGDLDIQDDLRITGNGFKNTVIDGGGTSVNDRVFHIDPASAGIAVSISGLTIQHGNVSGDGGGILVAGKAKLTMNNVVVSANAASQGGGIYNRSNFATITLTNVAINGNRAAQHIGGLANQGVATLTDVAVSNNTAGGSTGGFFNGGVATLTNVVVNNNAASGSAGGLFIGALELGGDTTLTNTTISGNTGDPGAIWNGGRSSLTNVTINGNTGGILNCNNCGARITLKNTIVANSYFILNLNCYGTITSNGHNLDSGNSCGFSGSGDIVNADPLLGPLQHSVGPTSAHALLPGSPALNAADNSGCPATDQRGVSRPQGSACDIGAYEQQLSAFVVNSLPDLPDASPGDGVCQTASVGLCSLRAAVMEANAHAGPDLITFGVDGIFSLNIAGANEDAAATGDLDITGDLTIIGNGTTKTVVDGGGATALTDRVFHIDPAGVGIAVLITGVTIQHGHAFGYGGGILNGDTDILTLTNVAVSSNMASDSASANGGGGIWSSGVLALDAVTVNSNSAKGNPAQSAIYGGGIVNNGDLRLSRSTIDANTSDENGGGVWNGVLGVLMVTDSTISANTAAARGGGIWNFGALSLTNVTVSANFTGNTTSGAIHNLLTAATLTNVTIGDNNGGGIANSGANATVTLKNTIVANSAFGANCSGAIISKGHNLDSANTCGFSGSGDIINSNPMLGPLANYGGPTETQALLPGSPAINTGDNAGCPPADQRGVSRPWGIACDIGAYEWKIVFASPKPVPFADRVFRELWERTDLPLAANLPGLRPRSWIWGPHPLASEREPYAEGLEGSRLVQYFDKGRMEISHPDAPRDRWYVTSGLLAVEMIEGRLQIGESAFAEREPADEAVAGDPSEANPAAPTYRSFRTVAYPVTPRPAPRRAGELVTEVLAKDGGIYDNPNLARYNVLIDAYDEQLGHNIPQVFTSFFVQQGLVREDGRYRREPIIDWLFVMGLPISEPYWARVRVGGVEKDVLIQAFQRRVLTYTPDNPPDWRVEMGNIGLHYLHWRYG